MKNCLFLLLVLGVACATASAQKITLLPAEQDATMQGITLSPNGKYVAGVTLGKAPFIADWAKGEVKFFTENGEGGVRGVSNSGLGIGYCGDNAGTFDYASGATNIISDNMAIGEGISVDGSFMIGSVIDEDWTTHACYWKDAKCSFLPEPTSQTLGHETNGTAAKSMNEDASTIVGWEVDNFSLLPCIIWHRNKGDSTYSVVPVSKRFFDDSDDGDGFQPYAQFSPSGISANGKWVAITVQDKNYIQKMARYDAEADTLQVIESPAGEETMCLTTGIANDGTILGFTQNDMMARSGLICKAGENKAQLLAQVYPTITELATFDSNGLNSPCAITADGNYIAGFGYKPSPNDDSRLWMYTYVIDVKAENTGIPEGITVQKSTKPIAEYTLDGREIPADRDYRGVVIQRQSNGEVQKILRR